jgi:hypothetical protein
VHHLAEALVGALANELEPAACEPLAIRLGGGRGLDDELSIPSRVFSFAASGYEHFSNPYRQGR